MEVISCDLQLDPPKNVFLGSLDVFLLHSVVLTTKYLKVCTDHLRSFRDGHIWLHHRLFLMYLASCMLQRVGNSRDRQKGANTL